jgi:adenylate cyclase
VIRKLAIIIAPILLFLGLTFFDFPAMRWLENKSIDWRFSWRGPIAATGDVVVVALDDKSVAREGRWPWPREKVAQLLREIQSATPQVVVLDIIFSEPSAGDEHLAQALRDSKSTILGYYFYQLSDELKKAEVTSEVLQQSYESILPAAMPEISGRSGKFPEMAGVVANVPMLAHAAAAQGYFNVMPDPDGSVRRFYLMANYRDKIFPFMGLEALSRHEEGFDPVLVADSAGNLEGIAVGKRLIPTTPQGSVLVNYRGGTEAFRVISATDVLAGKFSKEDLDGKTVLVGATAVGIYDLRVTPISPNLPGVVAEANLLDMLYRGDFLVQDVWTSLWNALALSVIPLLLGIILFRLRLLSAVAAAFVALGAYGYCSTRLFAQGYVVALAAPALEWLTMMMGITIYRGWTEERQKRQIRQAFRAYLHPKLVEELTEHPESLALGGKRANCTMLFCDVKSFSTISEKMDPENLTRMMNAFFDPVCQAIMNEGGYIDKLIGDAVMAIFGAPVASEQHALQACRAALAMQQVVHALEPKFQKEFGIQEFKLRIGIHTGPVVVGNMGTRERLNYTVMGDTVNLASRLEGANKELGTDILISHATYEGAQPNIAATFVDTIQVKGKEEQVKVYALTSPSPPAAWL